jgi:hypothetical protein
VGEAPLDACVPLVDRPVTGGQYSRDLAVAGGDIQRTPDAAVAARGVRPGRRRADPGSEPARRTGLGDRPGGTRIHTAAACHTVRFGPGPAGARRHDGVGAPPGQGEGEGALYLGAHADTPAAGNAQVPVEVDVRVGVVSAPASGAASRIGADPHRPADMRQLTELVVGEGTGRQR